jgi:hypothetical protein
MARTASSTKAKAHRSPKGRARRAPRDAALRTQDSAGPIPGHRYEIEATYLRRETSKAPCDPSGVFVAGRRWFGLWTVGVIDHPLFSRAISVPEFHDDGSVVRRGDLIRLVGLANQVGELDCRAIALRPSSTIGEIVTRRSGALDGDLFAVRPSTCSGQARFPFVIVAEDSPLMPGDVARFVGVRSHWINRGIESLLDCRHDGATVEILSRRYARPSSFRWTQAAYDYHDEHLYRLFGDDFIDEIAACPENLNHSDLPNWRPRTKAKIWLAARSVSPRWNSAMGARFERQRELVRLGHKEEADFMWSNIVATAARLRPRYAMPADVLWEIAA